MKKIIIVMLSVGIFFSCNGNKEANEPSNHNEHKQHESTSTSHDHKAEKGNHTSSEHKEVKKTDTGLTFNNGKKWIVNKATHVGMANIKALLIDYVKNDKTDHVALASAMSKETSTLINKCDMVGPDHDQLHLILMPILESIDGIKKSKSAQPIMDLSVYLSDYFDHFELAHN